jgi:hypothetical protein
MPLAAAGVTLWKLPSPAHLFRAGEDEGEGAWFARCTAQARTLTLPSPTLNYYLAISSRAAKIPNALRHVIESE